eukprot:scaffold684_cov345-Pavlova_lutheri.AAC.53
MQGPVRMDGIEEDLLLVEHEYGEDVLLGCQADTRMEGQLHHCTRKHYLRTHGTGVGVHHRQPGPSSHVSSPCIGRGGGQQDVFAAMQHEAEVCTQGLQPGGGHTTSILEAEPLPKGVLLVAWILLSATHGEFVRAQVPHGASEAEQRLSIRRESPRRLVRCVGNAHGTHRWKPGRHLPPPLGVPARLFAALSIAKHVQQSFAHGACLRAHTQVCVPQSKPLDPREHNWTQPDPRGHNWTQTNPRREGVRPNGVSPSCWREGGRATHTREGRRDRVHPSHVEEARKKSHGEGVHARLRGVEKAMATRPLGWGRPSSTREIRPCQQRLRKVRETGTDEKSVERWRDKVHSIRARLDRERWNMRAVSFKCACTCVIGFVVLKIIS